MHDRWILLDLVKPSARPSRHSGHYAFVFSTVCHVSALCCTADLCESRSPTSPRSGSADSLQRSGKCCLRSCAMLRERKLQRLGRRGHKTLGATALHCHIAANRERQQSRLRVSLRVSQEGLCMHFEHDLPSGDTWLQAIRRHAKLGKISR